jgi:dTDP-4-amino-4,6-dideoxygalactose transaminase
VDIDPETFNLDPLKIESAITPKTSAIMPVHCYGTPCDVESIQRIADRHGLKVIYDAAHAFGVRYRGQSLLGHGDLSVLSFHATKVFNTFEGGAIVCHDAETKQRIDYSKNFGFADEVTVVATGINGKMNEFQSALGLLQLRHIDAAIERRRRISEAYTRELRGVAGITCCTHSADAEQNYSYFPILVGANYPLSRDDLCQKMREHGIYPRRYFYPLITEMPMYKGMQSAAPSNLPVATRIAREIVCLPIFTELEQDDVLRIVKTVRSV